LSSTSDGGFAILLMRILRGWTQAELAERMGSTPSVISEYETGRRRPSTKTLEKVARLADIPAYHFRALMPLLDGLRSAFAEASTGYLRTLVEQVGRDGQVLSAATAQLLLSTGNVRGAAPPPAPEDREKARGLWERLQHFTAEERWFLVSEATEYQSWALCELLCKVSAEERDRNAGHAKELAALALLTAELAPGSEPWRQRLQGYAWACLGRARQAGGDRNGAKEALARSRQLWEAGAPGDPGRLLGEPEV
jgi:transcriptional regulator with XRE-family HTH domain